MISVCKNYPKKNPDLLVGFFESMLIVLWREGSHPFLSEKTSGKIGRNQKKHVKTLANLENPNQTTKKTGKKTCKPNQTSFDMNA